MSDTSIDANAVLMAEPAGVPWAKFPTIGTTVKGSVVSAKVRQRTAYETNEPLFRKDGSKDEEIVIVIQTDERDPEIEDDDGRRSLHAPIWSLDGCMRLAILNAVKESGATGLEVGGMLVVKHDGMNGKAKTYKAKYTPPAPIDDLDDL